jgi:predicted alpha/beta hydrolase family esterase
MPLKTADCDILIVPGHAELGSDHWQARWAQKLSTARHVDLGDWHQPSKAAWADRLARVVASTTRPTLIVAHQLGALATVHAAPLFPPGKVVGAFLVTPPDPEKAFLPGVQADFLELPRDPLPFPSVLIASRNDTHCAYDKAEDMAYAWGSALVDAGESGRLNSESGHGPWPEGLMRLAGFLKVLG